MEKTETRSYVCDSAERLLREIMLIRPAAKITFAAFYNGSRIRAVRSHTLGVPDFWWCLFFLPQLILFGKREMLQFGIWCRLGFICIVNPSVPFRMAEKKVPEILTKSNGSTAFFHGSLLFLRRLGLSAIRNTNRSAAHFSDVRLFSAPLVFGKRGFRQSIFFARRPGAHDFFEGGKSIRAAILDAARRPSRL